MENNKKRFQLPKDRVSAAFSHSGHNSISNYVQQQHLEHAATGLKAIHNSPLDQRSLATNGTQEFTIDNYYDLSGRKVVKAKKGVYVKNGKKIVVK